MMSGLDRGYEWSQRRDSVTDRPITTRAVWYVTADHAEKREIKMVLEEPLYLRLNGQQIAVLMRLPGLERELVVGFCISEGIVSRFEDVIDMGGQSQATGVYAMDVQVQPESIQENARLDVVRLVRAGTGAIDLDRSQMPLERIASDARFRARDLVKLNEKMRQAQWLRRNVGGVHAAALFDIQGDLVVLCEDVGRHNAVDKVVGHCFLRGISLTDKILLCSGRLSYEMVTKSIRVGIPVLASVSTPTALAVEIAERFGLTLIGYLRDAHLTIYAHRERVLGDRDVS